MGSGQNHSPSGALNCTTLLLMRHPFGWDPKWTFSEVEGKVCSDLGVQAGGARGTQCVGLQFLLYRKEPYLRV